MARSRLKPQQIKGFNLGHPRYKAASNISKSLRMRQINFDTMTPYEVYKFLGNVFSKYKSVRCVNSNRKQYGP